MSAAGGFASAVLFGFSGFFTGNAEHVTMVITASYFPWILLLLEIALTEKIIYAPVAGVMLGLAALGGNPTMWVYSCLMLPIWCLLKYGLTRRVMAGVATVLVIAAIVFSPSLVSFLFECKGYTDRTGVLSVTEACDKNRFPIQALVSMISPALTLSRFKMLSGVDPSMSNGYIGIWGLLCLICAFFDKNLRREYRWLLFFMVIAFLFSLGSIGGLRVIGYYILPVLKYVRHTGVSRVFWMLGGCLIAGFVFDRLIRGGTESPCLKPAVLTGLVAMGGLCWTWLTWDARSQTAPALYPRGILLLQAILVVLLIASLFLATTTIPRTAVVGVICVLIVGDAALHVRSNRFTICDENVLSAANKLERLKDLRDDIPPMTGYEKRIVSPASSNRWAFDGNFYVRAYLATTSKAYEALVGSTQFGPFEQTNFLRVLGGRQRFWLVPTVVYVSSDDNGALSALRKEDGTKPLPIYIHDQSISLTNAEAREVIPGSYGRVEILSYKPTEVMLAYDAPSDSWLFATERYAASWRAFVDGKETPLHLANWVFRAIQIPAGKHLVRMAYTPWIYKPFLVLSWAVSALILVSWVIWIYSHRRHPGQSAP
jgi:hypothetical protein